MARLSVSQPGADISAPPWTPRASSPGPGRIPNPELAAFPPTAILAAAGPAGAAGFDEHPLRVRREAADHAGKGQVRPVSSGFARRKRTIPALTVRAHAAKVKALRRAIADTEAKSSRLIRTLETTDDLDPGFISGIKQRRAELLAQRDDFEHQIARAQQQAQDTYNPALLDQLPVTEVDLEEMTDERFRRSV